MRQNCKSTGYQYGLFGRFNGRKETISKVKAILKTHLVVVISTSTAADGIDACFLSKSAFSISIGFLVQRELSAKRDDVGIVPYGGQYEPRCASHITSSVTLRVPPSPQEEGFGCAARHASKNTRFVVLTNRVQMRIMKTEKGAATSG